MGRVKSKKCHKHWWRLREYREIPPSINITPGAVNSSIPKLKVYVCEWCYKVKNIKQGNTYNG